MLKLLVLAAATAAATVAASSVPMPDISAGSPLGKHLLSKARRLEDEDENDNNNNNNNEEINFSWVSGYSIKFQGCHHVKQWNDEVDDEDDVRIQTKRLIRFRLCPSGSCSAQKAAGCASGYGEYVIDMDTFMEGYFEGKKQSIEYNCEQHLNNNCACDDEDAGDDDAWDRDYCEYDCFNDAEMYECIDRNPYVDDEGQEEEEFNLEEYMACNGLDIPDDNGDDGQRRLEEEEEEAEYFVGPHCSEQGGAVTLALFSDDSCTVYVEDTTFEDLMGFELPYSKESLVGAECLECIEHKDEEENDDNDNQDADEVTETCEMIYKGAGKCEIYYPDDLGLYNGPNTAACNYIEGIRILRQDGFIYRGARPSAVSTAFIVIFAMAFSAMAFYVWYLRTRLGVKKYALL